MSAVSSTLAKGTAIGATAVTLSSAPRMGTAAVVIDPYTTEAEIRLVAQVAGNVVTLGGARSVPLEYAHASGDQVIFCDLDALVPWPWWGARAGSTSYAGNNVLGFNRLTKQLYNLSAACWSGVSIPAGVWYVDGELRPERDQTLCGVSPMASIIKAVSGFPFDGTGEVAIIHPYRDGIPVKYTPDAQGAPSARWFMRDFRVDGSSLPNSNGILDSPQQPDSIHNVRVQYCTGLYGMCLADVQQAMLTNVQFLGCAVSLRLRGARFVWVRGFNSEQATVRDILGESQPGGSGSFANHVSDIHLESMPQTSIEFSGHHWHFEDVFTSNPVTGTLFYMPDATGTWVMTWGGPVYVLDSIWCNQNSPTFKMVDDVTRGYSVTSERRVLQRLASQEIG